MRQLPLYILLLSVACPKIKAQYNELNMVFGTGMNYILSDNITGHRPGGGMFTGLNFLVNKRDRGIVFNPGVYFATDIYSTQLAKDLIAKLWNRSAGINLDVLLKLSKKHFFRLGITYCFTYYYTPDITAKNGNQTVISYTSDELYKDMDPYVYQAKITAGICIPLKFHSGQSKSRTKLNILLVQNAIPLMRKDYSLPTYNGYEKKVLWSSTSYPTNLVISLEVNLVGKTEKNNDND